VCHFLSLEIQPWTVHVFFNSLALHLTPSIVFSLHVIYFTNVFLSICLFSHCMPCVLICDNIDEVLDRIVTEVLNMLAHNSDGVLQDTVLYLPSKSPVFVLLCFNLLLPC